MELSDLATDQIKIMHFYHMVKNDGEQLMVGAGITSYPSEY